MRDRAAIYYPARAKLFLKLPSRCRGQQLFRQRGVIYRCPRRPDKSISATGNITRARAATRVILKKGKY